MALRFSCRLLAVVTAARIWRIFGSHMPKVKGSSKPAILAKAARAKPVRPPVKARGKAAAKRGGLDAEERAALQDLLAQGLCADRA